jgi:adenylate kinase family enzyme
MIICAIIGLPGCGKTTLADLLAARYDAPIFAAGRQLQERASAGDVEARRLLANGLPIPRSAFARMLTSWHDGVHAAAKLLVVDGSPRTPGQVDVLRDFFDELPSGLTICGVLLDVPRSTAEHRLRDRRRGDDRTRHDEDDEAIARRIEVQIDLLKNTEQAFRDRWPLMSLDGTKSPVDLLHEAEAHLVLVAD